MPYVGRGTAAGFGAESTWGTPVSRTIWMELVSESMAHKVEKAARGTLAESAGSLLRRSHIKRAVTAGGTIEVVVTYEGFGLLMKHGTWADPTTGTISGGVYPHTYKLAASPPAAGLTVEIIRGDGTAEVFAGCRIAKMTIKIEAGGLLRCSLDLIAKQSAGRTSAGTASYTGSRDLDVMHYDAGTVGWNSGTTVPKSLEFTIDHKMARRQLLGSLYTPDPKPSDYGDVMLKMDHEWNNDDIIAAYVADDTGDLTVTFTGTGSRDIVFTMHNAYIEDAADPISSVGIVGQTATFKAQSDGTDLGLAIVIHNTQSSAVAG